MLNYYESLNVIVNYFVFMLKNDPFVIFALFLEISAVLIIWLTVSIYTSRKRNNAKLYFSYSEKFKILEWFFSFLIFLMSVYFMVTTVGNLENLISGMLFIFNGFILLGLIYSFSKQYKNSVRIISVFGFLISVSITYGNYFLFDLSFEIANYNSLFFNLILMFLPYLILSSLINLKSD